MGLDEEDNEEEESKEVEEGTDWGEVGHSDGLVGDSASASANDASDLPAIY